MADHTNCSDLLPPVTAKAQQELATIKAHFISLAMKLKNTRQMPVDLFDIYPKTANLNELYAQLSYLKQCLDSFRPFNTAQLANLQKAFDTEYTYDSNRIEGNTLTLMETDLSTLL